jgi:hypothetical protein
MMKRALLVFLAAVAAGGCSAPGFPERKPGEPGRLEVTVEGAHTSIH